MPNLLKLATKTLRPRRNYKRIQEMLFSTHKNKLPKKKNQLGVSRKLEGNIIDLCVFFLEGKANYCRQKKKKPERRILGRKG
jgi:hypothetical protein